MSNCCSHGTFLHFGLQGSRLNICYYHRDLHRRPFRSGSRADLRHGRRALLLVAPCHSAPRPGLGATLERHPFSGPVASAGELLHTPWRVPTSVATVLLSGATDTFPGI